MQEKYVGWFDHIASRTKVVKRRRRRMWREAYSLPDIHCSILEGSMHVLCSHLRSRWPTHAHTYLSSDRSVVRRINLYGRTNTKFDDGHYVYIFESTWDNVS